MIFGRQSNKMNIYSSRSVFFFFFFLFLFFLVIIVVFVDDLDEERSFAVLTNELVIFSGIELSSAKGAERDFSAHVVLNTRRDFQSQSPFEIQHADTECVTS